MAATRLLRCDFEVFGIVQNVFFRKCAQERAKALGLRGWCMNTRHGTMKGQLEGEDDKFHQMKKWLLSQGNSNTINDDAVFTEPKEIDEYSFSEFKFKKQNES